MKAGVFSEMEAYNKMLLNEQFYRLVPLFSESYPGTRKKHVKIVLKGVAGVFFRKNVKYEQNAIE